jgi:protease I
MDLSGKKVLIFAGPDFEDRELFYPLYRFQESGASVKVAGIGDKSYKGKYGIPIEVSGNSQDYVNERFDVVIIPGGWAPDKIRAHEPALEIVRKASREGAIIGAICHAGWVLVSADVIAGRKVTSYKNIKQDMINAGAEWVDQEVVVDGNIITSRTPADLPAFCRELISAAAHAKVAVNK